LATTEFVTTADNLKANLASPTFTGTPAAPTASAATSTTQIATTAFVTTADNLKANLASPTFTGTPTAPTASAATSTTQIATTAFVTTADNLKAPLASPTFTGVVTLPAGAVGAPSLTATGDTDTGLWFPSGGDIVAISTGGSERARIDSSGRWLLSGGTAAVASNTWYTGGSTAAVTPSFQQLATSTGGTSQLVALYAAVASSACLIQLAKSRNATVGSHTVVNSGDTLGTVSFAGSDGSAFADAAMIRGSVDTTPGAGSIPGRLSFYTVASAGTVPTERLRIASDGTVLLNSTTRLISNADIGTVGASANNPPRVSITGTSAGGNGNVALANSSSGTSNAGELWHVKSLGATPVVTSGTLLGATRYYGHDSSVYGESAVISALADALASAGSTPGRLAFYTAGSGALTATERMRINSSGYVQIGGTTANVAQVYVQHDSSTVATALLLRDSLATGAADSGNTVEFNFNDGTTNRAACFVKGLKENGTSGNTASYMTLGTRAAGSGSVSERLRIDSTGQVGVGITAPTALFQAGNATNKAGLEPRSDGVSIGGVASANLARVGGWYSTNPIPGSAIHFVAQGVAGQRGALSFLTKATDDDTNQPTVRAVLDGDGVMLVGSTASRQVGGLAANLYGMQIEKAGLALVRNVASSSPALFAIGKSRSASAGGVTIVQADDEIARMEFCGADGVDVISPAARISVFCDGTPGSDDMPGRMLFYTTPDGSASPQERARITSTGLISLGGAYDAEALRVTQVASAVNRVEVTGATTGNTPVLRSNGSDTNVALTVGTKGTGQISFATNGAATEQARFAHVASAVNYALIQGGATGTPVIIQTGGSDTNRDIKLSAAGTGVVDLGTTSATTATAGAQTLPANPAGFLNLKLNGSAIKVPYYNA
jgi:hypothetical protein